MALLKHKTALLKINFQIMSNLSASNKQTVKDCQTCIGGQEHPVSVRPSSTPCSSVCTDDCTGMCGTRRMTSTDSCTTDSSTRKNWTSSPHSPTLHSNTPTHTWHPINRHIFDYSSYVTAGQARHPKKLLGIDVKQLLPGTDCCVPILLLQWSLPWWKCSVADHISYIKTRMS